MAEEEGALFPVHRQGIPPYELDMGECEDKVDGEVEGEGPDESTDEIALVADFAEESRGGQSSQADGEAPLLEARVRTMSAQRQWSSFECAMKRVRQHSAATASRSRCQK